MKKHTSILSLYFLKKPIFTFSLKYTNRSVLLLFMIILVCPQFNICYAQEKIEKKESDGFIWYKIKKEGKVGAVDTKGNTIIPVDFLSVNYNTKYGEFLVVDNSDGFNYRGIFKKDGTVIIPTTKHYSYIQKKQNNEYGFWYSVAFADNNGNGICNEKGQELLSPNKGYTSAIPYKHNNIPYVKVYLNEKEGICDINGNEIISPQYTSLSISSKSNIFIGLDALGNNIDTKIHLNDSIFTSIIDNTSNNDIAYKETLVKGIIDENDWYKIYENGKYGAKNLQGELIVPVEYIDVTRDVLIPLYYVKSDKYCGAYDSKGKLLISTQNGYNEIEWTISDCFDPWFIVKKGEYVGACDVESGNELISPERHYTDIKLDKDNDVKYFCVWKGEKLGICSWNGKELVPPLYKTMGITNKGTFAYLDDNGSCHDLYIKPDGSKYYVARNDTDNSTSHVSNRQKKKKGNNILRAFGLGLLSIAASMQPQVAYPNNNTSITGNIPMPTYNGNGSEYVTQIQNRLNQQSAYQDMQIQQMTQDAINQTKYGISRLNTAICELRNWSSQYASQNDREPYEFEKDQWMQQHYPDVYPYYIQGKYDNGSTHNREMEVPQQQGDKKMRQNGISTRDCVYCNGTGKVLVEHSVASFGLGKEKGICPICQAKMWTDQTHAHIDCSHCRGTGVSR